LSRYLPAFQQHAPEPPDIYDLEQLCERSGVLEVRLVHPQEPGLNLVFSDHLAFRKAADGDALVTLHSIGAAPQAGKSFYLVEDSDYIRWFIEQGYGIRRAEPLQHITIVTLDDVIDVIALSLPAIVVGADMTSAHPVRSGEHDQSGAAGCGGGVLRSSPRMGAGGPPAAEGGGGRCSGRRSCGAL
jgi:hypothetical protein